MEQSKSYIFFDEVFAEYVNKFGKNGESFFIEDLKKYLKDLAQTSKITIITRQDTFKISNWFLKHDLYQFTDGVTNPVI